ncbi:MAG: hypothetical protein IH933_12415, partial [Euryarchaeota archaeon]|nr:hypothetical protein [Euryarchaeota archaeon]
MNDDQRGDPLYSVSPLDGRYASRTTPLSPYASEAALMRARVRVEVEYLIALADLEKTGLTIDDEQRAALRESYKQFDTENARLIKRIETEGNGEYSATNHDVKAVEYFVRERLPEDVGEEWIHFGLTSEDVNNLAHRLLCKPAVGEVLVPKLREVRDGLSELARENRDVPMLARTHGQPATPRRLEQLARGPSLGPGVVRVCKRGPEGLDARGLGLVAHPAHPGEGEPERVGDVLLAEMEGEG